MKIRMKSLEVLVNIDLNMSCNNTRSKSNNSKFVHFKISSTLNSTLKLLISSSNPVTIPYISYRINDVVRHILHKTTWDIDLMEMGS